MLEEKNKQAGNLHRHFMLRVMAPPFVAMLVMAIVGMWQLGKILHRQEIDGLKRSASTTAVALEREFTLRETILKQTGAELFIIKSEYTRDRGTLEGNRDACRAHMQKTLNFKNSPAGACEQFFGGFALGGASLAALENEYIRLGEAIITTQNQRIDGRLTAFKQFFPETLALLVLDDTKQTISSAYSSVFIEPASIFQATAESALNDPVRGKQIMTDGYRLAVFAFKISGGSVLAAYDIENENFIQQVWAGAPIDRTRELAVVLDSNGSMAYPLLKEGEKFAKEASALRSKPYTEVKLQNVDHTVVGASAGGSDWIAAVASPTAAVLAALRNAQLISVVFIGLFMVGFLWVGTYFIQRTLRNLITLVSGALVFGSGRLDYKIALDHADSEFVRLADTMNAMAERIAATEKAIDEKNKEFISIATHELRAPLSAIIGHLSLFNELHEGKLDDKSKLLIDQVYYGTVRLRDLVNDMLNVARLESGRSEFSLAPVSIKAVIEDIVSNMDVVAKLAKVKLEYHAAHANDVIADEQRLKIIINNFVSNAIKYNRPDGSVKISHELHGAELVTAIMDNGLGIPEEQKAKMFEKFFRVENEDRKDVTGTGLGMYITKEYIDQMHGRIWFESEHGKGSTFFFSLPLVKPKLRARLKTLVKRNHKK